MSQRINTILFWTIYNTLETFGSNDSYKKMYFEYFSNSLYVFDIVTSDISHNSCNIFFVNPKLYFSDTINIHPTAIDWGVF